MSKELNRGWAVTPHGPLEKIDDNLWVVEGKLPGAPIMRRMSIVKRSDGTLLFYHAIPLEDSVLDEIRAWGKPAYLVVGHHQHMVDAHAMREKLGLKLYGPKESADKIKARTTFDGTFEDIPKDPAVSVEVLTGTKLGEPIVIVNSGGGAHVSLLFCDAIQNNQKDTLPLPLRLIGFAGTSPKVVPLFRLLFMGDRATLKAALLRYSDTRNLSRIIPFHGAITNSGAAEALRAAANDL
jgi:hypothetical protein